MFSRKLRELRQDMSQAELAKRLGVTQQAVGRWEKDLNMPDMDTLRQIADIFCVTTDYLLDREPEPGYYLDDETARRAEEMRTRPGLRVLFDASRKLKPQDLEEVNALIQAKLKRPEYDE